MTKDTPGAVRAVEVSKKWYGRYTDAAGKTRRVPLSESKETARRMLNKIAGDAGLGSVGLTDPYAEHRQRPLLEHLDDFGRYLAAKGNGEGHVRTTVGLCRAVVQGCRFVRYDDLQPSAVVEFLAGLRHGGRVELDARKEWYTVAEAGAFLGITPDSVRRMTRRGLLPAEGRRKATRYHRDVLDGLLAKRGGGIGIATSNHYLAAVKTFSKWLVKDRRAGVDPLAHLDVLDVTGALDKLPGLPGRKKDAGNEGEEVRRRA